MTKIGYIAISDPNDKEPYDTVAGWVNAAPRGTMWYIGGELNRNQVSSIGAN